MTDLTLYLANRNYSSWSLRAWLVMKAAGLVFDEVLVPLDQPNTRAEILRLSPSGRLPVLCHGNRVVWDSAAIAEYLAELCPDRGLWPADPAARATARSISAEMHGGFQALRGHMPMNIRSSFPNRGVTPDVQADINRIASIWREQRRQAAEDDGPFLFGAFSIADAVFAPVVSRFRTYEVELDEVCRAYADAVWQWPAMREWVNTAGHEPMIIDAWEF